MSRLPGASLLVAPLSRDLQKVAFTSDGFSYHLYTSYSLLEHCILSAGRLHLANSAFLSLAFAAKPRPSIPHPLTPFLPNVTMTLRDRSLPDTRRPTAGLSTTHPIPYQLRRVYTVLNIEQSFFSCLSLNLYFFFYSLLTTIA